MSERRNTDLRDNSRSRTVVPGQSGRDGLTPFAFRLDPLALGAAVGTVLGMAMLLATAILLLKAGPVIGPHMDLLAQYMPGFRATWAGALIGFAYGFAGGFAAGWLIAGLHNLLMIGVLLMLKLKAGIQQLEAGIDPDHVDP